jgi:hypothetical protein
MALPPLPIAAEITEDLDNEVGEVREENERLRDFAIYMQGRFAAYREHFGTQGIYPDPKAVRLLAEALRSA